MFAVGTTCSAEKWSAARQRVDIICVGCFFHKHLQQPQQSQSKTTRRKSGSYLHCVSKNIPDIFECNLKTNYQILIIFGANMLGC